MLTLGRVPDSLLGLQTDRHTLQVWERSHRLVVTAELGSPTRFMERVAWVGGCSFDANLSALIIVINWVNGLIRLATSGVKATTCKSLSKKQNCIATYSDIRRNILEPCRESVYSFNSSNTQFAH